MILQLRQWPKIYVERRSAIICAISAAAHTYMQSAHMTRDIEKWYCAKIANIIGTGRDLRKVAVPCTAARLIPTIFAAVQQWRMSVSKYSNRKTEINGIVFDSAKEARRWQELKLLERAGKIAQLQRQQKFVLIPAQREKDAVGKRGQPVKGKLLESECAYYADFCYFDVERMAYIVEDVKGVRTPAYVIKRKLMLDRYGIQIREI